MSTIARLITTLMIMQLLALHQMPSPAHPVPILAHQPLLLIRPLRPMARANVPARNLGRFLHAMVRILPPTAVHSARTQLTGAKSPRAARSARRSVALPDKVLGVLRKRAQLVLPQVVVVDLVGGFEGGRTGLVGPGGVLLQVLVDGRVGVAQVGQEVVGAVGNGCRARVRLL
uniref:(northern house mosquito) hypothetical protein n=1 Tax=Culex pipiens TaxID=7175 RepID=A0A8D8CWD1_CULPI